MLKFSKGKGINFEWALSTEHVYYKLLKSLTSLAFYFEKNLKTATL